MARLCSHSPVNVAKARRRWTRSYLGRGLCGFVCGLCRRSLASERCVRVARAGSPSMMLRKVSSTKGRGKMRWQDLLCLIACRYAALSPVACRVRSKLCGFCTITRGKVGAILPAPVPRDAQCGRGKSAFFESYDIQ